jgi:ATP-dependent Lon protease
VAVTLAIASVMSKRPVRRDVAVTGEVTLRGRVLEIGGVKEKVLAAYRAGLREVIMPASNEKDLRGLPDAVRSQMQFGFAKSMDEVIARMLLAPVIVAPEMADSPPKTEARTDDVWDDPRPTA